jgi:uncharacterized FAD-dependent dehydrogenase
MPLLLRNITLPVDDSEERLVERVAQRLRVAANEISVYSVRHRSLDARRKDIRFNYQVEVALTGGARAERSALRKLRPGQGESLEPEQSPPIGMGTEPVPYRATVIGFGPGGMFAALRLAEHGHRPLVLERGREVRRRHRDIMHRFYRLREFDETSNLLFGEGGAGTYSDGKLYTRVHDPLGRHVLEVFFRHGADPDILIDARPHIGSDRLPTICTHIREHIESLGGEVRFECQVDDIRVQDGRLTALRVTGAGWREPEWVEAGPTILAAGHSARDTIRMLHRRGVRLVSKPFQVGVRIEHPQALVDQWQYGTAAGHSRLGAAEYHVVAKGAAGECGDVYSFCMCPGGVILPTNESAGLIATNGASRSQRSGPFANSGLVITIDPKTLGASTVEADIALQGMSYQEHWERLSFIATKQTYKVPAQRAVDFLNRRVSDGHLETSYPLGGQWSDISNLIPETVAAGLRRALPMLDGKFPGFAGEDGIITAPETRASAPFRILRDQASREAVETRNLYPVGEGAGYAGGIVSAAIDGIKTADVILARYAPPR